MYKSTENSGILCLKIVFATCIQDRDNGHILTYDVSSVLSCNIPFNFNLIMPKDILRNPFLVTKPITDPKDTFLFLMK